MKTRKDKTVRIENENIDTDNDDENERRKSCSLISCKYNFASRL